MKRKKCDLSHSPLTTITYWDRGLCRMLETNVIVDNPSLSFPHGDVTIGKRFISDALEASLVYIDI